MFESRIDWYKVTRWILILGFCYGVFYLITKMV